MQKASDMAKKSQHFSPKSPTQQLPAVPTSAKSSLPPSVSWKGICGPPHNQNMCGAPPLVTTDAICAWHIIKTGLLIDFSSQELIDCCCTNPTTNCQCQGYEWKCVIRIGGLCTEQEYPYGPTGKCRNNTCTSPLKIHGAKYIQSGNETALQVAIVMQPVATIVDASHASFQFYSGGVYDEPDCSSTDLDHMMLIEGYGSLDGVDYWLVKNSWGEKLSYTLWCALTGTHNCLESK